MSSGSYCNINDVCDFPAKHRMAQFMSYGIHKELVHGRDGLVTDVPAIKPPTLFRGQTKPYETLRPSIYRNSPPMSLWKKNRAVRIDNDSLLMPNPYYSDELEHEFYFSCIKAAELITVVSTRFPEFPGDVDGHALEADEVPPETIYEIGFQPLPRPHAQRGSLLQVPPNVNLLAHPAISAIYFRHSKRQSEHLGKRFDRGQSLVPNDEISAFLEERLTHRLVTTEGVNTYLERLPVYYRKELRSSIEPLFHGSVRIT